MRSAASMARAQCDGQPQTYVNECLSDVPSLIGGPHHRQVAVLTHHTPHSSLNRCFRFLLLALESQKCVSPYESLQAL